MTTPEITDGANKDDLSKMAWLLEQFATTVPGVKHCVLLARDGLKLLHSDMDEARADKLSAGFCGLAALAQRLPGPMDDQLPPQMVMIERPDGIFFCQGSGVSGLFRATRGNVDTLLAVIAEPDADSATIGYEMARLIDRFAPYMMTRVRTAVPSDQTR
ncbi:roadblock/LC7 domain-containing protein [Streptomyces sp. NPDC001275]